MSDLTARQALEEIQYELNTSGCPIEYIPDLIRTRAYELYEARGSQPGCELNDWLQAEREVKHHWGL